MLLSEYNNLHKQDERFASNGTNIYRLCANTISAVAQLAFRTTTRCFDDRGNKQQWLAIILSGDLVSPSFQLIASEQSLYKLQF